MNALSVTVIGAGGVIFGSSPAKSMRHDGKTWNVETPSGRVVADALLLATNAYSGEISRTLAPNIAREVVPVLSWQMATEPIGDNARAVVLPGRPALSDTHGDLHFARYDARHRLVTGGALVVSAGGAARLKPRIGARIRRMFPSVGDVRFDYVWNGYIGMTTDYMPRFHRLGPNGFAWVGCNGRGVALSIALGREFAKALTGTPQSDLALPFTDPKPLPLHDVVRLVAPLKLVEVRWRDAREI